MRYFHIIRAGTSAMTIFSYLVSGINNKNYREPEVLGQLVERLPIGCSKESVQIAGWSLHYAIGILLVVFYDKLWKQKKIKPSFTSGALLGAASGPAGIIAWKGMFKVHPIKTIFWTSHVCPCCIRRFQQSGL